jgi:hypothetical protein
MTLPLPLLHCFTTTSPDTCMPAADEMDSLQQEQRAAVQQHHYGRAQQLQRELRSRRDALDSLELQVSEAFSQADRVAQLELQLAVDQVGRLLGWLLGGWGHAWLGPRGRCYCGHSHPAGTTSPASCHMGVIGVC